MKKRIIASILTVIMLMTMLPTAAFAADGTSENTYEVSTVDDLSTALTQIATSDDTEATIVLKADITLSNDVGSGYISFFGANGKHITVKSEDGKMKNLSFPSYGVLTGDCTFDNVNVTGRRLFCNGYRTIFTENGQIHLSETLYGGGYKTTVDSTYVVIAANGYINPTSYGGLHDVIGGSYQGSVEGDTYLEITGDIKMQSGNHLNPGCIKGDGSSGDGASVSNVYVGGNATLIYDNQNDATTPAIEGTYGCEMKGNVTLDIRSGRANEICGTQEFVDTSIIRGDLHIIAGSPDYENTDRTLRLNANWPIVGAGNLFAADPDAVGNYTVGGNITIDTYENVWSWDKGVDPTTDHDKWYDIPEIYGAIRGNVGGSITINAHGSHVENITGASDSSTVGGDVTINATNVELKNCYYEDPDYDEGDIYANYKSTINGKCAINVDGGDVNIIRLTNLKQINEGSQITITGSPKIRTGVISTSNYDTTPKNVAVTLTDCTATIPFIQSSTHTRVTNNSDVKLNGLWLTGSLTVDEGSILKTDDLDNMELSGNVVVNGTWEQLFINSSRAAAYDVTIAGTMTVGTSGKYIGHGSTHVAGDVSSCGMMALMKPSEFGGNYAGTNAELRLPAVVTNYTAADIPLKIGGLSTGTTTVNTVDPTNWQTLKKPALGDNYILSKKNTDSPAQDVFVLGNADAVEDGWFLKRMADADGSDNYYMWQVANGVRVIFDKNGGDTEADPRIMMQDKVTGVVNHFDLPTIEPTRGGYTFKGWNTKADGSGDAFTATTDVTSSMTVYAQWKKNSSGGSHSTRKYTLTYVSNGGTGYQDETFSKGTKVTLDKAPIRESYTFTGWYTDEELTDKITSVTMTSDKTVYAGWVATGVPDMLNGDDHDAYVIGYPDGNVRPQGNISRAETATIFFRLLKADTRDGNLTAENVFADVANGKWFNKAVSTMAKLGIVKGRSAETFAPDAPITRAEFAAICARFNTKPTNTSNSFSDISGHWAEAEIERAVAFGWIAGYPDGTFRPDTYITRAEAMTMINRVLCRMPQDEKDLLRTMVVWPDNKPTDWYYLAVQEATNSHEFERKGAVNEKWTKLTSAPDWTRYQ